MSRVSHVLDTSALLAHYFDEPGADIVERLWADRSVNPGICAVTVAELRSRLKDETTDKAEAQTVVDAYVNELAACLPVDRVVAEAAWHVKEATPGRLPLVDSLIAATARAAGAVLVHRDPHMAAIPREIVDQIVLPDR